VKSKIGEGTIFTVRIPVRTAISIGADKDVPRKLATDVSQAFLEGEL